MVRVQEAAGAGGGGQSKPQEGPRRGHWGRDAEAEQGQGMLEKAQGQGL